MVLSIQDLDDYTSLLDLSALKRVNTREGYNYYLNGNMLGIGTRDPQFELDVNGTVRFVQTVMVSDIRKKKNVTPVDTQKLCETVKDIGVFEYEWAMSSNEKKNIGFIAQDVEKVEPSVVTTNPGDGVKGVDHMQLTGILFGAVKALIARVESLESEMRKKECKQMCTPLQ